MSNGNSQTLVSRVHQHLLSKLASREFSKGSHLNATDLAQELGASRTTVRKAIDHLIEDNWVEIDQNRHPVVVNAPRHEEIAATNAFEYENQTERTYRAIQEKVLRSEYEPGQTVRAPDLVAEFKVSLITVRQALDWLCKDGMFIRIPRKGWQVASLTVDELTDLYHCRLLLEPVALKEAMKYITTETIDRLEAKCDAIIAANGNITRYERLDNDMQFHRTLVENAGSHTLSEVIAPLIRKRFAFKGQFNSQHQPHTYAVEHKAILQAIRAGDLSLATKRLTDHISRALNTHLKNHKFVR
mgnify:CR=1 FL=1|tara:strand:- start:313 stop:1212 length:900 start_codon:yes stop_codon:yes gene_type:complete